MNEKKSTWRIEIEQHLPMFTVHPEFADRVLAENQQPRFVSINIQLTPHELDDFLATIHTGFQTRIISVTNISNILVNVVKHGDIAKIQLMDGSRRQIWASLERFTELLDETDVRRMNANFDRDESFRTWIDQTDWSQLLASDAIDRIMYQSQDEQ